MNHPTLTKYSEAILAITARAWHVASLDTKGAAKSLSHLPENDRQAPRIVSPKYVDSAPGTIESENTR